nr:glycosyltransferase family 61 protein [Kineococcus aurantiacus]
MLPDPRSLRPPEHLPGTTVTLLSPWSPNYYHWTVQVVPRALAALRALPGGVHEVDHWLVPGRAPAFVPQWLDALGVPPDRRVEVTDPGAHFATDRLVAASVPGRNRWVSPQAVDHVRAAAPAVAVPATGRRLVVHRTGGERRVLLNADAVLAGLEQHGFEVVDPATLTLAEEVETFAAADVVVGVHGAGLTNLVFTRPGAAVVELTPRALVYPTFVKLARAARVRHRAVVGSEPRLPWPLRFPDARADLVVDVPRLLDVVGEELDRSAAGLAG